MVDVELEIALLAHAEVLHGGALPLAAVGVPVALVAAVAALDRRLRRRQDPGRSPEADQGW